MERWKHIVVGGVVEGIVKSAFATDDDNPYVGEVRKFRDDLSVGRIDRLMETYTDRINWFAKITDGTDFGDYLKDRLEDYVRIDYEDTLTFEPEDRIVFWHSGIVSEQVTLRYLAMRFSGRELWEVDASKLRIHYWNGMKVIPRALGECSPPELMEAIQHVQAIPEERMEQYRTEWKDLEKQSSVLRILEEGQIIPVEASYYDQVLMHAASDRFKPAAEVIGAVMGSADQIIADTYLNFRLRQLIEDQRMECQGSLYSLGSYQVRLNVL